jgi:hypothetical protein
VCSWRLVADDVNDNIVVTLEEFDTDNGLPCLHGNLSIYDGNGAFLVTSLNTPSNPHNSSPTFLTFEEGNN